MSVFVTTMYRYGDREKHSYVLGVWSSSEVAMQAGQTEALWRGGKYEPEVTEWKVDANEFDDIGEQRLTPLALDGVEVCPICERVHSCFSPCGDCLATRPASKA